MCWFADNWKQQAAAEGRDVIDLSVGASDLDPPKEALDELRVRYTHVRYIMECKYTAAVALMSRAAWAVRHLCSGHRSEFWHVMLYHFDSGVALAHPAS